MPDQTAAADSASVQPIKKKFGGPQAGAGRPKGSSDKVSKEIKDLCKGYTEEIISTLIEIVRNKKASPVARIAAGNSILDRGWGKPTQTIAGDPDNPPVVAIQVIYAKESHVPLPSSKFKMPDAIAGEIIEHHDIIEDEEDYDTSDG